MSRKRRRENIGEDKDDSNDGKDAPGGRTLKALREGKGRKTQMTPAKQRYSIKLKTIAAFKNMPRGEVGILVVLPVGKGDLIFEHTNTIPPGVLVSVLEALQQEMPDYRIEEALEEYKAVQVAVERRGGESYVPTAPSDSCCAALQCMLHAWLHMLAPYAGSQWTFAMFLCSFQANGQTQGAPWG